MSRPRIAVVGGGIAGLGTAWHLCRAESAPQVVLFEADGRFGGHAHTVDVTLEGVSHGVDTGFLVFNHATYPHLRRLFAELGVATAPSEMSFSVQVPGSGVEWSGSDLGSVFAQRRNLLKPRFLRMLADLLRFNRLCKRLAEREQGPGGTLDQPLGDFLDAHRFSAAFRDWYLLPMLGSIWSCPTDQMLRFPVVTMVRFCHNHGLIRLTRRPPWFTVAGGSRQYVQRLVADLPDARAATPVLGLRRVPPGSGAAGVWLRTAAGEERFDDVVLACHSDQVLALLGHEASADERSVLGAIRYHRNRAVLHTDARLMPKRRQAWAAWNYERAAAATREEAAVCLHYWINRLQPLPWRTPVIVSLNPAREPDPARVLQTFDYAHPVFDHEAIAAQQRLPSIQGRTRTWFAGAWTRYGFHEDGLQSALAVVAGLRDAHATRAAGLETRAA